MYYDFCHKLGVILGREDLMKRIAMLLMSVGLMLLLFSAISSAQEKASKEEKTAPAEEKAAPEKVVHKYVGVSKCKLCHSSAKIGDQYGIWAKSKHAQAYKTLATSEADSVGKAHGVDAPQKSAECLGCHVTAYGAPAAAKAASFSDTTGVECETCHGPGSDYLSMKVMKDRQAALANGLIIPTEKTCVGCHNEKSPTYKKFVYAEFVKQIAHPIPKQEGSGETK
jgi:hypothetical protein